MLPYHARDAHGSNALHANVYAMDQALREGKLRVAASCIGWWEEYRKYHYDDDGHIVALGDDIISASRYGWMMLRYAQAGPLGAVNAPMGIPVARRATGGNIPGWVY